jgi:hypothetical protein
MDKVIQPSFATGELSPSLFGRVDLAKYRTGCAVMRNFYVDYRGGASNRPGSKFVGRAFKSTKTVRLIPFQFSTIQTYVLEFGDLYMRVIKDDAHVLEAGKNITGVTNANPGVVTAATHGFSNGDWVYISGVGGTVGLNGNTYVVAGVTTNTFQLTDFDGNSVNTVSMGAFTSGGTAARYYTLVTPWLAADLALLKFTQSADTMTITHPSYKPQNLTRTGHASWTLTAVSFAANISAPTGLSATPATAGTTYIEYVVTAVDASGQESLPSVAVKAASNNITTTAGAVTVTWAQVTGAQYYNVYRAPIANNTDVPAGANHGYVGVSYGTQFVDGNIVPDFTKTPPLHYDPFAQSAVTAVNVTTGGAGYVASTTSASITDPNGTGASIVPIVVGGAIVAFIVLNGGSGYTSPTINITGAGAGFAGTVTLGAASGTYPSTVAYFQQRQFFAAPTNAPETLYGSRPGAYKNMDYSNPTVADDSLNLTLAAQQVNNIKYMLGLPGGLVVLTGGGAWQINGGSKGDAVTPTSATATPQSFNGCADLPPLLISYDILYVQAKGSIVRDLSYNFYVNVYTGTDLTVLSNHLFNPHSLTEWCWAEEPFKLIWAVRDDGMLLSCTFLKEQEVLGWARHDTQGLFKSITTIQQGQEDVVYFVVQRYINSKWVQYIERFASRIFNDTNDKCPQAIVEDSWFVDCGLDYPLVKPAAGITLSRASGVAQVTADAAVFAVGDIGKVLRAAGGIATVTGYTSSTVINVTWSHDAVDVIPNDPANVPVPQASGSWSLTPTTKVVTGLSHLEGKTVKVLGDGSVFPDKIVSGGSITLEQSCSRIIVGLGYTSQLQTLDIEGGQSTLQGKRKKLAGLNLKVQNTRGIKYGPTFDLMTEVKQRGPSVYMGDPIPLLTGQFNVNMDPSWTVEGRMCIQQDYPLPVTILSVAPDILVGDT